MKQPIPPRQIPLYALHVILGSLALWAGVSLAQEAADADPDIAAPEEVAAPEVAAQATALPQRSPHVGVDADLFSQHSWYSPPPAPVRREVVRKPVETRPTAPPLPYAYMGRYEQGDEPTLYFLVRDDRTYDVHIGDTLDGTYRVDGVSNGQLMFTYLPLNTSQGLRLGE